MTMVFSEQDSSGTGTLLPLEQVTDHAVAGRKAATLARLRRLGYRVPESWIIPAETAKGLLARANSEHRNDWIQQLPDVPLAIRSSGIDEDSGDASYAGQYETVLNVQGENEILDAIRQVLESASSARLTGYRANLGASTNSDPLIAVLIQPMIDPDAAGVAFSANPVTGERTEVVINATRGLADRLLDGETDAETWTVRDQQPTCEAGNAEVLSSDQAQQIAALVRKIENDLGEPQDVEWALTGSDLVVLQARPITALPIEPDFPPVPPGTWNKEQDHFPGQVSVLLSSIYRPAFREATTTMFSDVGALVERLQIIDRGGELYIQAVPLGERHGSPPPGFLLGLLARIVPEMRSRIRQGKQALERGHLQQMTELWERKWRDELSGAARELIAVDLESLDDDALANHTAKTLELCNQGIRTHFHLAMPTMLGCWDLVLLCEEFFGWRDHEALILIGATATSSSAPSRSLEALVDTARSDDDLCRLLSRPDRSLADIEAARPDFASALEHYLNEFGHRSLDNDIGTPTLYERPDLVISLIRGRLSAESKPDVALERQERQRQRAMELLRLRSEADRTRFDSVLDRAAKMNALREEKVLYTMYTIGAACRYAALEIGKRLSGRGFIARAEDIFFCTIDETISALGEGGADELRSKIGQRRGERAWVAANPGPERLGPPEKLPDPSWLPEPARYLTRATLWLLNKKPSTTDSSQRNALSGVPASPGRYRGPVRIIRSQREFRNLKPGDVLVCPVTTSAWGILFGTAGALVTEHGGILSHPAIAAREHGIPAVVGTGSATTHLKDGQMVTVDGGTGTVSLDPET